MARIKDIYISVEGRTYIVSRTAQIQYCKLYEVPVAPLSRDEQIHLREELSRFLHKIPKHDLGFRIRGGTIEAILDRSKNAETKSSNDKEDLSATDARSLERITAIEAEEKADDKFFREYAKSKKQGDPN